MAFDAEVDAILAVTRWYQSTHYQDLIIHSDSTSTIARASHTGAGPGQDQAISIHDSVSSLLQNGQTTTITWVKEHAGTPGNERADALAGKAAERKAWAKTCSLAYLKLQISERF